MPVTILWLSSTEQSTTYKCPQFDATFITRNLHLIVAVGLAPQALCRFPPWATAKNPKKSLELDEVKS